MAKLAWLRTSLSAAKVLLVCSVLTSISAKADFNDTPIFPLDPNNPNCAGLNPKSHNGKPFATDSETYDHDRHWIPWNATKQAEWDPIKFTDPRQFDAKKFRFIVHGLSRREGHKSAEETYNYIASTGQEAEKIRISTSLINQDAKGTFSGSGFILRVPAEIIVASDTQDMFTGIFNNQAAACRFGLLSPERILEGMPKGTAMWNEVLLQGKAGSPISVVGVFIVDRKKESFKSSLEFNENRRYVDEIRQLAKKKNLPVISISTQEVDKALPAIVEPPAGGIEDSSSTAR